MKNFRLAILVLLTLFLNSCAITQEELWGSKINQDEIVKDLLINQDGNQIIVVGEKYYYFVDDEKKMVQKLFLWNGKESLVIDAYVRARGAEIKLSINFKTKVKDLSQKQLEFIQSIDGRRFNGGQDISFPNIDLMGSRIRFDSDLIKNKTDGVVSTGLVKKEYQMPTIEDPTPPQIAGKILLTPFAVVADILLAPIYFIGILGAGVGSK